jgi:hypothetical protein
LFLDLGRSVKERRNNQEVLKKKVSILGREGTREEPKR